MNKIMTSLLLATISLFASIDQVQTYYDAKQYEDAITEAKASSDEYANPQLHLLWAKSAEALGRENEAMSAYERVEMLDEGNIDARVALVNLYNRTGRDDLAVSASKELQNYQLSPEQRASLDKLRGVDLDSFKAFASLAIGHDTNVNVAPGVLDNEPLSSDEIATLFARLSASASYTHDLEEKGGWYGRGDIVLYNQTNFDDNASMYDLFLGGAKAGAGFSGESYDIYVPLGYDIVNYLDRHLLNQLKIEPRVNYTISNDLIASADLSYVARSYAQEADKIMDDSAFGVGAGIYYLMGKDYYFAKAKYESISKVDSNSSAQYIDKTFMSINLGANYNIVSWLVLKADYKLRMATYDDNDRSDTFHQLEAKFSHYFLGNYEAYVSERYIANSSNIATAEYSKNILMFGVSANY